MEFYYDKLSKLCKDLFFQDRFSLYTPGGGGYGKATAKKDDTNEPPSKKLRTDDSSPKRYAEKGSVFAFKVAQESA